MKNKSSKNSNIYLTGFMGSGKTTLGKLLALKLNFKFMDLDQYIEKKENSKVLQIFSLQGEKGFRALEAKYLKELALQEKLVISLGGGTLLEKANSKIVQSSGRLIYLKLDYENFEQRILGKNSQLKKRPLAQSMDKFIFKKIYDQRLLGYKKADLMVETSDLKPLQILKIILTSLRQEKLSSSAKATEQLKHKNSSARELESFVL